MIVLVLAVLAGLVLIGVAVENWRDAIERQQRDTYERESHHRLLREIRRQP